jgi:hypothetical protein
LRRSKAGGTRGCRLTLTRGGTAPGSIRQKLNQTENQTKETAAWVEGGKHPGRR